jgi:hypothetical protein
MAIGCATGGTGNLDPKDLTDRERTVRVYEAGEKPDCRYDPLGTVEAASGSSFEVGTYASNVAKMQRNAAALGATGVIVMDHSKTQVTDQTTGVAIRCKSE